MAQKKFALVIGNSKYVKPISALRNPVRDSNEIAAVLKDCGFSVTHKTDLDSTAFTSVIADYKAVSRGAEVALIYYSGHGLSVNGNNHLLPTDARIVTAEDLQQFVSVEELIAKFAESSDTTLFFFNSNCKSA